MTTPRPIWKQNPQLELAHARKCSLRQRWEKPRGGSMRISIRRWTDKEEAGHVYRGIFLRNKTE